MKYIISGTGRSGTTLIHSILKELGVNIGQHEISLGTQGGVGGPNLSVIDLENKDPILFKKAYNLYNKIENANKKT